MESQISAPTPATGADSKTPPRFEQPALPSDSSHLQQHLTLLSVEIFALSRGSLLPDPTVDPLCAIAYTVREEIHGQERTQEDEQGVFLFPFHPSLPPSLSPAALPLRLGLPPSVRVRRFASEGAMIEAFIQFVRRLDPDIILGYEVQKGSLGYMVERAAALAAAAARQHDKGPAAAWLPLSVELSRIRPPKRQQQQGQGQGGNGSNPAIAYAQRKASGLSLPGRILLNVWRLLRHEVKLRTYTLENVAWHVLRRRVPHFPAAVLTRWFTSTVHAAALAAGGGESRGEPSGCSGSGMARVLEHVLERSRLSLEILDTLDLIGRTSEMARVFGIKFFDVLFRGSQYRVESMLLRLARPQNFLMTSLSREQVARQAAMECMPLIMEPISRVYTSPVIVLDFQSLYPSMMIAYNLCYSTCLGRLPNSRLGPDGKPDSLDELLSPVEERLGGTTFPRSLRVLARLREHIWISPNGVMFLKPHVRKGVLPRMLQEILDTRVMVKQTMKLRDVKAQKALLRVLNARQFCLKLLANVTYGYTAAGFSGRMPCAEIADSIVQSGRETLERAIKIVESDPEWRARVVYGDTDSLFVLVEGRTREEAFRIGQEIAARVTQANPKPVKLQMEKVYQPCALVSKKRYVGFMYESATQTVPTLDAKGIETG